MRKKSKDTPKGRLVEVDGVTYLLIDGNLLRYADLTFDKGFKIVLGCIGSEEILRHLLNRLLGTSIVHLEYRNTEHPGMTEDERSSRFDVYCEDEIGRCFQVEMQNWSQKHYFKRAIYYSSLVLMDQVAKEQIKISKEQGRKWDYDFQPLYVVSFVNFKSNDSSDGQPKRKNPFISTYRYSDVETKEELSNSTNLVFIDLHNFCKREEECESLEDLWMYSIKNMHNLLDCPEKIKGTEIEDLYIKAELAKMKVEQRKKYEEEVMTRNDILNSIAEQLEDARKEAARIGAAEGREEGLRKGMAEGLAKGRTQGLETGLAEGRAEVIRQFHSKGMSAEQIADLLDADVADIEKILL